MMRISVQSEAFDAGAELAAFTHGAADCGAVVSFTGLVRGDGGISAMQIEHYPGMTEKAIEGIALEAARRWALGDILVIHRYGHLKVGTAIMMVATASRHRRDAFEAAEFLMDYLKSRAPFWKKESGAEGAGWVDARAEDEDALDRW